MYFFDWSRDISILKVMVWLIRYGKLSKYVNFEVILKIQLITEISWFR